MSSSRVLIQRCCWICSSDKPVAISSALPTGVLPAGFFAGDGVSRNKFLARSGVTAGSFKGWVSLFAEVVAGGRGIAAMASALWTEVQRSSSRSFLPLPAGSPDWADSEPIHFRAELISGSGRPGGRPGSGLPVDMVGFRFRSDPV